VLDDFRRLDVYEGGRKSTIRRRGDKGHRAQFDAFLDALLGAAEAPSTESYLHSTRATLALADSIRMGKAIDLN
jgi:hypothetical protein